MLEMTGEIIDTLKELQSLDTELRQLREGAAALSSRVEGQKKRVTSLEGEREALAQKLRDQEKRVGMKELDVKGVQEKINRLRQQLNVTSSNKEYQTMLKEIGEFEADKSRREDEELAMMDAIDDIKVRITRTEEETVNARKEVSDEESSVAEEVKGLQGKIDELQTRRDELAGRLNKTVLDKYDRILNSRNGLAVVAVIGGTCQGCNMGVTKQVVSRLWSKKELIFCNNCSRILYLEGDVN